MRLFFSLCPPSTGRSDEFSTRCSLYFNPRDGDCAFSFNQTYDWAIASESSGNFHRRPSISKARQLKAHFITGGPFATSANISVRTRRLLDDITGSRGLNRNHHHGRFFPQKGVHVNGYDYPLQLPSKTFPPRKRIARTEAHRTERDTPRVCLESAPP